MAPIKTKAKNLDMTQGKPARLLVLFAIPMLIGGIYQRMRDEGHTPWWWAALPA